MRLLAAPLLFVGMVVALATAPDTVPAHAQDKKDDKKKAQPKVDPKTFIPDAATLKQIKDKTEELRKAIAALKEKKLTDDVLVEVEIYLKAAENIVRFEEWLAKDSIKWTFATLEQGLSRAKQAEGGKAVWRDAPGKWVVRAYRSRVDDSIQPYAVLLPHDYGKDPKKQWRLDVVLHGRDGALTEAKFIGTHQGNAPKDLGYVQLEPYGRGNNAYRWAGETDVFEAFEPALHREHIDANRIVLRGFSMGGAGTWHIGLHHPGDFSVIGPGAGFTTTHGYIANLPKQLPDYQEKCLRIYDAIDYTENAFNVPVVAYSGEKDGQKKAADNIENALKGFKEPFKFTHLIAPGLEHQMPKPWQEKAEVEYRKYADRGRDPNPKRVRFVTYTPQYASCSWLRIDALETTYQKATADVTRDGTRIVAATTNVRLLSLDLPPGKHTVTVDGQKLDLEAGESLSFIEKRNGRWVQVDGQEAAIRTAEKPEKRFQVHGPIDHAFTGKFTVIGPTRDSGYPAAALKQFAAVWDRYFRGTLPTIAPAAYEPKDRFDGNLVLFGTPDSNPLIAKVLPKLPITWTKDKLVVNGVEYDPKTHLPVLIFPNPLTKNLDYVVINSGHTFKETDLKGTNALLYPRLGDWAVIKPTPTEKDPAAYEVVAAGLFDENWQFPKK
ncbi:hypothetical protein GobsT_57740 [Gemmata obscuriglobus]|uniref:Peptidase S9 prolyl oligopeptidase catalytic domain-containing protein n=1 Tax=Gemmata obscuriglobus TaxID=114 RepID=A0A2Z3H484_9BACT|nr:prolyl oligopeptidase family serine peptidase [Gemmata obscuriglobus]AWM36424.1 hypothetical protein C1280_04910 [Gemmata obscuriglobus]QEG30956.1 hypothetical protein GobsT_57740 [Gemmata obscuriglobus]VTS10289.1 Uncharacterized protein OS=Planctomyces maris DSM 8797 GN=PM8797T_06982 PE=4 SV=1 [Gemmata obscuriglobus UQM 2246]